MGARCGAWGGLNEADLLAMNQAFRMADENERLACAMLNLPSPGAGGSMLTDALLHALYNEEDGVEGEGGGARRPLRRC